MPSAFFLATVLRRVRSGEDICRGPHALSEGWNKEVLIHRFPGVVFCIVNIGHQKFPLSDFDGLQEMFLSSFEISTEALGS